MNGFAIALAVGIPASMPFIGHLIQKRRAA